MDKCNIYYFSKKIVYSSDKLLFNYSISQAYSIFYRKSRR